jgi:hypothetical protein
MRGTPLTPWSNHTLPAQPYAAGATAPFRVAARDPERKHEYSGQRHAAGAANPGATRCYNRGADFLAAAVVFRPNCAAAKSGGVRSQRPRLVHHVGEWLSLVEHLVRDQGVGGSNPLSPTNFFRTNNLQTLAQPPGFAATNVVDFVAIGFSILSTPCL